MIAPITPVTPITPALDPPYHAVIFTSRRTSITQDYDPLAETMLAFAARQPGYLGVDSVRDPASGTGITVSYWRDEAAIAAWRRDADHRLAQQSGRAKFYENFTVHIAHVTRSYDFQRDEAL